MNAEVKRLLGMESYTLEDIEKLKELNYADEIPRGIAVNALEKIWGKGLNECCGKLINAEAHLLEPGTILEFRDRKEYNIEKAAKRFIRNFRGGMKFEMYTFDDGEIITMMSWKNIILRILRASHPRSAVFTFPDLIAEMYGPKLMRWFIRNNVKLILWASVTNDNWEILRQGYWVAKKLRKISFISITNISFDFFYWTRRFTPEQVNYVINDIENLPYSVFHYLYNGHIMRAANFDEYLGYISRIPAAVKQGKLLMRMGDVENYPELFKNVHTYFDYMVAQIKAHRVVSDNIETITKEQYKYLWKRVFNSRVAYSRKKYSMLISEINDFKQSCMYVINNPHTYPRELVATAKNIKTIKAEMEHQKVQTRQLVKDIGMIIHIHNERVKFDNREKWNDPTPVRANGYKMPPELEQYRLRTFGDYAKCGDENRNCVIGYRTRRNSIIYRFNTVTVEVLPKDHYRIAQCYDKGNKITPESKRIKKYVKDAITRWVASQKNNK